MAFETTMKRPQYFLENEGLRGISFYDYYLYLVIYIICSDNVFILVYSKKIDFLLIYKQCAITNNMFRECAGCKLGWTPVMGSSLRFFSTMSLAFCFLLHYSCILVTLPYLFDASCLFLSTILILSICLYILKK